MLLKKTFATDMIPKGSGSLIVWVVIIFVLAWGGGILGPSVKWCSALK